MDAERPPVVELPTELYLRVLFYLDLKGILEIRKTCKYFHALTQDRGIWMSLFQRMRTTMPLLCSQAEFQAMPVVQAQRVLFATLKAEASLLTYREHAKYRIPAADASSASNGSVDGTDRWRALSFISDRFLLSVHDTAVNIWDVSLLTASPAVPPEPWAHFDLANFIVHAEHDSTLYISVTRDHGNRTNIMIYSVLLPEAGGPKKYDGMLCLEAEFPLRESEQLKYLDPASGRALLYSSSTVDIVHWRECNRRVTVPIQQPDDHEEKRHDMIDLRVCGPYVLCFWLRSVAAYPIPTGIPVTDPLPEFQVHRFGAVNFGRVSISRVRREASPSGERHTLFMLAYDNCRGTLHYRIQVQTRPVPSMSVDILADGRLGETSMLLMLGAGWCVPPWQMCVSTLALGHGGLQGVWVGEGVDEQRVLAFRTHPSDLRRKGIPKGTPHLQRSVVHVTSRGSQDGIKICATSDMSGRIALGSRRGDILVL